MEGKKKAKYEQELSLPGKGISSGLVILLGIFKVVFIISLT